MVLTRPRAVPSQDKDAAPPTPSPGGISRRFLQVHRSNVIALVLAVMLLAALTVPAFADGETAIKIASSSSNVNLSTHTFEGYQILSGNYTDDKFVDLNWGSNMTAAAFLTAVASKTTIASDFENYLSTVPTEEEATAGKKQLTATAFADIISGYVDNAAKAQALAEVLDTAKIGTPIALKGGATTALTAGGYYLIKDTTTVAGTSDAKNKTLLFAAEGTTTEMQVKTDKPELDKKIDEHAGDNGRYNENDLVYDNHRIGDTVPYVIRTTIPDMSAFTKYYYIVTDTMSKGLAFTGTVTVNRIQAAVADDPDTDENEAAEEVVTPLVAGTDYTVTPTSSDGTSDTNIEIIFKDFLNKEKDHAGEAIEITYSATVTKDAIIGSAGNPNSAKLIFSNNPDEVAENEPGNNDKPKNINVLGSTPVKTVRTYVTGLKVIKVNEDGDKLADATFELSGNLNKVEVIKAEKYVESSTGNYWALKDGSYTTTDPDTLDSEAENYTTEIAKYADKVEGAYKKYSKTTVEEKTASGTPTKKVSETTDANGVIIFDGMGDGEFTLTETATPAGYNSIDPISFKVTWAPANDTTGTSSCTWDVTNVTAGYNVTYNDAAGEFVITVENKSGVTLPSTGGIGTTIFYVAGSVLVLAAAILLITKRRMGAQD